MPIEIIPIFTVTVLFLVFYIKSQETENKAQREATRYLLSYLSERRTIKECKHCGAPVTVICGKGKCDYCDSQFE